MQQLLQRQPVIEPMIHRLVYILRIGFILLLCGMYIFVNEDSHGPVLWFAVGAAVVFCINFILYSSLHDPKWSLIVLAVDFCLAASYGFVYLGGNFPDQLFVGLVGLLLFMRHKGRKVTVIWFSILITYWAALLVTESIYKTKFDWVYVLSTFSFVLFASAMGSLVRFYQEARDEATVLNNQLLEYMQQAEKLAAEQERNRIAREIHDNVGHSMTALLVQLQAIRKLQIIDTEKSAAALVKSESLARTALQDLRLSVRAMQPEEWAEYSFRESLDRLINDFKEITGMNVLFYSEGDFVLIRESLRLSIFRIIQETLTNAKKHGHASLVTIRLLVGKDAINLTISDDGQGIQHWKEGFGLKNMRRRVEEYGGTLAGSSEPGAGFRIHVLIPVGSSQTTEDKMYDKSIGRR